MLVGKTIAKCHSLISNDNSNNTGTDDFMFQQHKYKNGLKSEIDFSQLCHVRAMKDMPPSETNEDVPWFLDSIQYLAKVLPMLAEVETPLRELTRKDFPLRRVTSRCVPEAE